MEITARMGFGWEIHLHQKWDLPGLPEWEPSKICLQIKHQRVQIPKNMSLRVKTVIVLVQCRKYVQYIFHVSHFAQALVNQEEC